ncbi:type I-E CRISPR-associated protein Cse1/CasA [Actinosynnema sp. NPDC050436]|uniref:type I-E CRISPR-associated protein Cse1/CasA n=1 Tax=Actinosynnema sp. NPDC050436 TaxID=3155659 RepID=UPI0033C832A5
MTICDLRTDAVLRVEFADGSDGKVGLRELLLRAHEITDLALTMPPAFAGALRVLYVIAARVTGLDKIVDAGGDPGDEWQQRRNEALRRGRFVGAEVDKYLETHSSRWNLFCARWPWWQDPRLGEQAELKSSNTFDIRRPDDNKPIWWRHTHKGHAPDLSVTDALELLLIHHYYGSGGTGGTRTVGQTRSQHMSAGPLRSTVTFYPLGANLFETLIAGIPSPAFGADLTGEDLAPWETTDLHDPLGVPPEPTWPARLLVGQSRHALLLTPDPTGEAVVGCHLTWGWKHKHPPLRDPYSIEERNSQGEWKPRRASADRALWREVDALLADRETTQRPAVLSSALSLPDDMLDRLRIRAVGFDQDRKATNNAWSTSVTPPIIRYLDEFDPARANGAEALTTAAKEVATAMINELRKAYRALGNGSSAKSDKEAPWVQPAQRWFWPRAEDLFWRSLAEADFAEPHRAFQRIALGAITEATRPVADSPAVAREVTKAKRALTKFVASKNPRPRKEKPGGN